MKMHEFRITALRLNPRGHAVIGDTLAVMESAGMMPEDVDDAWRAFAEAFVVAEGAVDYMPPPLESPDGWCCLAARTDGQCGEFVGVALWRRD